MYSPSFRETKCMNIEMEWNDMKEVIVKLAKRYMCEKEKAFYTKGMEKENDMKVVFTMDYVMEEDHILIVWNWNILDIGQMDFNVFGGILVCCIWSWHIHCFIFGSSNSM